MIRVKEKRERALGVKLFLKAGRCNSPKCAMVRRAFRPGVHKNKRVAVKEYGKALQEKQKVQIFYGLNNRKMGNLFVKPKEVIMSALERRLDRVVFLLGFAGSNRVARQFVSHGHILVNGKKVTIPSYNVKVGDIISLRTQSLGLGIFTNIKERLKPIDSPFWLKLNKEELKGECVAEPVFKETPFPFDVDLVGQFYTK